MWKTVSIAVTLGLCTLFAGYAVLRYLDGGASDGVLGNESAPTGDEQAAGAGESEKPMAPTVTALGRLEPAGGVLEIGGQAGDRLAQLEVGLGDEVAEDQKLAVLGSHALREAELKLAQEQLAEARRRAEVEQRHADTLEREAELAIESVAIQQLDIESQQKKIGVVEANLRVAQNDLDRLQALRGDGENADRSIVSDQQLQQQTLLVKQAEAELGAARSLLNKMKESFRLAKTQAEAQLETARANRERIPSTVQVASLEKSVDLAAVRLETTIIRAPGPGRILAIFVREGETLSTQPILQMADTRRMVAVAEIYEDQVLRVAVGQPAEITSSALPNAIEGTVVHVGTMIGKNAVISLDPTASADKRVVEARIELATNSYAAQLINLQVTAEIETSQGARGTKRQVAGGQAPRKR